MHDFLFTFQSTHQSLKGERYHKKKGRDPRMIPTPFEIFAECGFSLELRLREDELEDIRADKGWEYAECYLILNNKDKGRSYEKI